MPIKGGEKGISARAALITVALLLLAPAAAQAATINVTHSGDDLSNDDTFCSLREALEVIQLGMDDAMDCVNSVMAEPYGTNDTVVIQPAITTITLTRDGQEDNNSTGDLDVIGSNIGVDSVTITGSGQNPTITQNFTAGLKDRIIEVPGPDTSVTLQDLVVSGGVASFSADRGGGNIKFNGQAGRSLTLDNVDVLNGLADSDNSGDVGGGIRADGGGQVTIQNNSLVSNNVAGFAASSSFLGGGIYITGSGTDLTVSTNSAVSQNKAGVSTDGTMVTTGQGGGIYDNATNTVLSIADSAIDTNQAGGGGTAGVEGFGGGIAVSSGSATVTLGPNVSVSNNSAGGGFAGAHGHGGGIYASGGGTTSLSLGSDTVVANNDAGGNGSGFSSTGGGIHTETPTTLTGAFVSGNDAGAEGTGANGGGGGIYMTNSVPSPLMITGSTLNGNRAGTASSGGVGGGILDSNDSSMTISGSTISNNTTISSGGGLSRAPTSVGAMPVDSISTSTVSGNTAVIGGGIYAITDGSLSLLRSTVNLNMATGNAPGLGGGLFLDQASGTGTGDYLIENSTIDNNTAVNFGSDSGGGGVHLRANVANTAPLLTVRSSTISDNKALGATGLGGNLRASGVTIMNMNLIKLQGSIVTGGIASATHENCSAAQTGTFQSLGGNVESMSQCGLSLGTGDLPSTPVTLGALTNNGGPTMTRAITTASPAFNLVPPSLCPPSSIDQIGTTRPQPVGGACDAGAFEVPVATATPALPVTPTTSTPTTTAPKKKCKKKKKKKTSAAAAKKCKKRKK